MKKESKLLMILKMDALIEKLSKISIEDKRTAPSVDLLSDMMEQVSLNQKFWFQHRHKPISKPHEQHAPLDENKDDPLDDLSKMLEKMNVKDKVICYDDYFVIESGEKGEHRKIIWKIKKCSQMVETMNLVLDWTCSF